MTGGGEPWERLLREAVERAVQVAAATTVDLEGRPVDALQWPDS